MLESIISFLKDLADLNHEDRPEEEVFEQEVPEEIPISVPEEAKPNVETVIVEEKKPQYMTCDVCGKHITWKESVESQKVEIEGIVAELQLMGYECDVDFLCHQCASVIEKDDPLSLQPYHFCFNWGNKDWNDELREIAKYYGKEFAQKSRSNHNDLRHKVIIDNTDEFKIMLQVVRRMNFRYPRKDISALLTEPEKRVYEKFTGEKFSTSLPK